MNRMSNSMQRHRILNPAHSSLFGVCPHPLFNAAFSLVELLVTLSVLCTLLILATPSMKAMLLNNRLSASSNTLVNALNFARSTALSQSSHVMLCPLGTTGSTTCGTNWGNGWIVVTQPTAGTSVLLRSQQNSSLDPTLLSSTANVQFDQHGLATTQSNFTLCDSRGGSFAQSIEVMATGFVQAGTTPGQAVWNNNALACP